MSTNISVVLFLLKPCLFLFRSVCYFHKSDVDHLCLVKATFTLFVLLFYVCLYEEIVLNVFTQALWYPLLFPIKPLFLSMLCTTAGIELDMVFDQFCKRSRLYDSLCNQCWSHYYRVRYFYPWKGVLDAISWNEVCQWFATDRWFSFGTLVSFTNKLTATI